MAPDTTASHPETSPDASPATTPRPAPADVAALLGALVREPGRPRLTWYGDEGERVELSGAVLENWVNKTTNLLVEELDAGPGTVVSLDLPAHWRTVPWALAALRAGATVVPGRSADADVVVTTYGPPATADEPAPGAQLVVVTLPALARRAPGPLPAGALDAAASVMTYGDALAWVPPADPARPAIDGEGLSDEATVLYRDLPSWWSGAPADRLLLAPGALGAWLRRVLGTLAADGSVVLLSADRAVALAQDEAALERLVAAERVTAGP
jgi:uncharacterized protein (TIGR03089 family)